MSSEPTPTELCGGRYRLAEPLGQGGMATVWRAWDATLRVERAIKLLSPEKLEDPAARARFLSEARTMAGLDHPGVLRVHDLGQDGPWVYMVMELATGGSLWDWMQRHGPMPPRLAVRLLLPVAHALEAAHAAGVVHRDVKPRNIMLGSDGQPHLADFGIARVRHAADPGLTRTGSSLGTWGYMAPEQRKDARAVDARADVYALGATLWALLAGEVPVDLFAWDVAADLGEQPEPLLALIRRATRFDPGERFESMAVMATALTTLLQDLPPDPAGTPALAAPTRPGSDALAPTRTAAPSPPPPSRPRWPIAAAAIALALGTWWLWPHEPAPTMIPNAEEGFTPSRLQDPKTAATENPNAEEGLTPSRPQDPKTASTENPNVGEGFTPSRPQDPKTASTVIPNVGEGFTPSRPQDPKIPPTEPPPTGTLTLNGDIFHATLIAPDGTPHAPGPLPPGSYTLEVALTNGTTITREGLVVIAAGEQLRIQCLASVENCRVLDP
jgi:serine/threonine protein kinase